MMALPPGSVAAARRRNAVRPSIGKSALNPGPADRRKARLWRVRDLGPPLTPRPESEVQPLEEGKMCPIPQG
jgi:hypothetical protein